MNLMINYLFLSLTLFHIIYSPLKAMEQHPDLSENKGIERNQSNNSNLNGERKKPKRCNRIVRDVLLLIIAIGIGIIIGYGAKAYNLVSDTIDNVNGKLDGCQTGLQDAEIMIKNLTNQAVVECNDQAQRAINICNQNVQNSINFCNESAHSSLNQCMDQCGKCSLCLNRN